MQSTRRVKSASLFSLLVFAALPLAASAVAQPPIVRTKPVIDQQLQMNAAREAKMRQARAHHEDHVKYAHAKRADHTH